MTRPKTNPNLTRTQVILNHLTSGRTLTQGEATLLGYGPNIARPILALRRAGHTITMLRKHDIYGNSYAEYRLVVRSSFSGNRKAS